MKFTFTEEHDQLRAAVADALGVECPPSRVREAWTARDAALRATLAQLGVLGLDLPEALGGLGVGPVGWIRVCEESGRRAAPIALAETYATNPILAALEPDLAARVATGDAFVTAGLRGGLVVDADVADRILLVDGDRVSRVDDTALTAQASVDGSRRMFTVEGVLTPIEADGAALLDRGALATAGELLGVAGRLIDLGVAYTRERRQFGKAIGSFQAVQHHLVDAVLRLRFAEPVVWQAAWALEHGEPDASVRVSMAKVYASEAAQLAARKALQVHGAIGYTVEYDLHLWMKRAWSLARAWGDPGWHLQRVSAHVLGDP